MKIIKSIVLVTLGFSATTLLHAQESKTAIAKPLGVKTEATANNKSSSGTSEAVTAATEIPSASARQENAKQPLDKNPAMKITSEKEVITPGGEEGRRIMTGTTSTPKQPAFSPSTVAPKPAPQAARTPVSSSQQQ